ncbi:tyrosine-type recombinase/integrase [Janthinobacterium sp. P210005]|uniref:tyrosine-type recombinase/integrase n=1 Tax=Janthinobacterium sp. P210005 TaxID=3112938 RepID=UPI002E260923|nr:site-specific integrase [Janthinobacterium sp. P210005]
MASFRKHKTGWRAEIFVQGTRESGVFSTKAEASAWAAERESQLRRNDTTDIVLGKTCLQAFERYRDEVSIHKKGEKWETIRLSAIAKHIVAGKNLGDYLVADVTPDILGQWRDMRLKTVMGSTVNRDLNLISHVFTTARREWNWAAKSPTTDVRRPKDPPPRDRLISQDEIDRICLALAYDGNITNVSGVVAAAFLFAIETGMRSGEILSLSPKRITGSVAHLPRTKNDSKRDVPLSPRALEILSELPGPAANGPYFNVTDKSRDTLFRKAVTRAGIEDLTFHDSRHEAITRLAKKLNILELARMVGHKDIRQLQVYYNETAAEIAKKL